MNSEGLPNAVAPESEFRHVDVGLRHRVVIRPRKRFTASIGRLISLHTNFKNTMGNLLAKIRERLSAKPTRILMLGLDAAGKTTTLHKLHLGESLQTIPTIGFNVQEVQHRGLTMTLWDVGGQERIRALWRHYTENNDGFVYLVDATDKARFEEARQELFRMLNEDNMRGVPCLIFANKMDAPQASKVSDVAEKMGLRDIRGREWYVQGCSAKSGDGLHEGLDWLANAMKHRK